jgi:hypothetical protein
MTTPPEILARFALQNVERAPARQRPVFLEAAADFLPDANEADLCRVTVQFIRQAEDHQLRLFEHFAGRVA